MQILLGLLVILACLARLHANNVLAGGLIAAAATVKPQFALLGLLAVRQGNWKFVMSFSAVVAAAFLISLALYGWTNNLDYLKVLSFLSQHGEYHHLNQSTNGMLNRWLYDGPSLDHDHDNPIPNSALPPYIPAVYLGTTTSSLFLIAVAFMMRTPKTANADIVGFCLSIMLFTMASPIAWVHHYNVVLPAVAVALSACLKGADGSHKNALLALVLLSFVLIAFPLMRPFGPTIPALNIPQSHVFIGGCILAGVLLRLLYIGRKAARAAA
jgi:alpha-1,2-mannosyltransferase